MMVNDKMQTKVAEQTTLNKVVAQSTLIVIAISSGVFMFFTALLTWVRQYLVLHTGN